MFGGPPAPRARTAKCFGSLCATRVESNASLAYYLLRLRRRQQHRLQNFPNTLSCRNTDAAMAERYFGTTPWSSLPAQARHIATALRLVNKINEDPTLEGLENGYRSVNVEPTRCWSESSPVEDHHCEECREVKDGRQ
jgi:hypothetical protein